MLITHEREKLINAILFFGRRTKFLGKTKLFKLLYFLDFEHYEETGRSVTGLDYHAWPKGPVPVALNNEIKIATLFGGPPSDMVRLGIRFEKKPIRKGQMLAVEIDPNAEFNPSAFTKREFGIMERLADEFHGVRASGMVEATHLEDSPWDRVYHQEDGKQEKIPYDYAIRAQEREHMRNLVEERADFIRHFSG